MRPSLNWRIPTPSLRGEIGATNVVRRVDSLGVRPISSRLQPNRLPHAVACIARSFAALLLLIGTLPLALAQEPVSQPPSKDALPPVFEGPGVRPSGFLFIDQNGEQIFVPPMSFEQLDRASDVEAGVVQPSKPYAFESIDIRGNVELDRAELNIAMRLNLAAPSGRWIAVPLQLAGFHPQRPFDVEGVENYYVDYSTELGGNILWVKSDQPRKIDIRVGAVSRVSTESGQGLEFKLPKASTSVELLLRGDNLDASVVGSGDEVVQASPGESGRTSVRVECNGGTFSLRWRARDGRRPNEQVLEVDSRMRISWDDTSLPASVVVDLDVNNRRGTLLPFDLQLPVEAEINEPLPSGSGVQLAIRDAAQNILQVTPDEAEQSSRIKFSVEYRLPSADYTPANPLRITPPDLPAAVLHRGEIEIRTDRSQRLRWRQNNAMRTSWQVNSTDGPEARVYLFQFDRPTFDLPVWLTTKQQPLRINQSYAITVAETAATLQAEINASGPLLEGLPLVVETSGWETVELVDAETARALDAPFSKDGSHLEIELGELTASPSGTVGVRWKASRSVETTSDAPVVEFPIPHIDPFDQQPVIVTPAAVILRTAPGLALIPDLVATQNLVPLPQQNSDALVENSARYQVDMVVERAQFRGYLTQSPAEAIVRALVEFAVDETALKIRNRWQVTPRGNLQGRMPIEGITRDGSLVLLPANTPEDPSKAEDSPAPTARTIAGTSEWQVTVDDEPAILRFEESGDEERGVIYSERLNGQPCEVQLATTLRFDANTTDPAPTTEINRLQFRLPRPAIDGDELQGGTDLRLIEAPGLRLQVSQPAGTTDEPLDLRRSPTVAVTIEPRVSRQLTAPRFEQSLVRSEFGRSRRYDRLLANVRGGATTLTIPFTEATTVSEGQSETPGASQRVIRVFVDDQPVPDIVVTRSELVIPLPKDDITHLLDVRIWGPRSGWTPVSRLQPPLRLPLDSGKSYWDVVLAPDRHLVWSRAGTSELMQWEFNRLFLSRVPIRSYSDLVARLGGSPPADVVRGNRYLLTSADIAGLQLIELGRPLLWLLVSSIALLLSSLLIYFPRLRHPLAAVGLCCVVAGTAWIAPDLAILLGQLLLAALVIVAVMLGTRATLRRRPRSTVLGGLADGSSIRSVQENESTPPAVEPQTTQLHDAVASGSTAGVKA